MDSDLSRRDFLKTATVAGVGAAAALAGLGGAPALAQDAFQMQYRYLGPSKAVTSVLAANETYQGEVAAAAFTAGVNYWHKADRVVGLGNAIRGATRDKHIIELCVDGAQGGQELPVDDLVGQFKSALQRTGLVRAEVFKMHGGHSANLVEAFRQLKREGLALTLAGSYHDLDEATQGITAYGIDHVQIMASATSPGQVWDFCRACKSKGVGVMAMKTKVGGPSKWGSSDLRKALEPYFKADDSISVALLRYVLAQDGVVACTPVEQTVDQFQTDVQAGKRVAMTEGEKIGMNLLIEGLRGQACALCGTCQKACPREIKVADIMRYDLYLTGYNQPTEARRLYRDLPSWQRASACDGCGQCERRCKQGLKLVQRLQEAHERLA